jgi:hypothetical protein
MHIVLIIFLSTVLSSKPDPDFCQSVWVPDYNRIDVAFTQTLRGIRLFKSMELHLDCDGTYEYINICSEFSWRGTWSYNKSGKMLILNGSEPASEMFPRTYIFKSGKLKSNFACFGRQFKELLIPQ